MENVSRKVNGKFVYRKVNGNFFYRKVKGHFFYGKVNGKCVNKKQMEIFFIEKCMELGPLAEIHLQGAKVSVLIHRLNTPILLDGAAVDIG